MKLNTKLVQRKVDQGTCRKMISKEIASALDRTNVSYRKANIFTAAAAQSLVMNLSDLGINRTSICRSTINQQTSSDQLVKTKFSVDASAEPVVVHWDDKILSDSILVENQLINFQ